MTETVTVKLTKRELALLIANFGASFVDTGEDDSPELTTIFNKLSRAQQKAKPHD